MKQTEITVEIFDSFETIKLTLEQKGFALTDTFDLFDDYFCADTVKNILKLDYSSLISKSILLREIKDHNSVFEMIYKNKTLNNNGDVVSEEKYKTIISDKLAAENILKSAGMTCWASFVQNCYIFKNQDFEFAVQVINGLGIFIEAEENEQMSALLPEQKILLLKQKVQELGLSVGADYSCKKPYMLLHKK